MLTLALPLLLVFFASTDAHPLVELPGLPELSQKWQGSWVVRDADYAGSVQAWNLQGDELTVYDATRKSQWQEHFSLSSPCSVVRTRSLGGEGDLVTIDTFAFAADGLHVGPPPAGGGIRGGPVVTACVDKRVYTFDSNTGRCQTRNALGPESLGRAAPNIECTIQHGPLTPSFVLRPLGGGTSVTMGFYGDALLSSSLAASLAEPQPTFAAAVERANSLVSR